MITPQMATYVLIVLAVLLAVIIPVLNAIPKLSDFISYRWLCVTIILLLMVGVVINFENLADETRNIVLTGGMIIVGSYLLFRTGEKVLYNGWLKGVNLKAEIKKGDTIIKTDLSSKNVVVEKKTESPAEKTTEKSSEKEEKKSDEEKSESEK